MSDAQEFGGNWTDEKLDRLKKYLHAYTVALKNQPFKTTYIDAFAGTGYRRSKSSRSEGEMLFDDLGGDEPEEFRDGSARVALQTQPSFDEYIFLEKSQERVQALEALRSDFPSVADRIKIVKAECNAHLQHLARCRWNSRRAVVFLDPYGMQVQWATIEAMAKTQAIDLWILFPHAMGVQRMLRNDDRMPESWRNRLTAFFGEETWHDAFYEKVVEPSLFGSQEVVRKIADLELIKDYFLDRLRSVFAGVANKTLTLCNSRGTPLYLLCFACANPKGSRIALRIANNILEKG